MVDYVCLFEFVFNFLAIDNYFSIHYILDVKIFFKYQNIMKTITNLGKFAVKLFDLIKLEFYMYKVFTTILLLAMCYVNQLMAIDKDKTVTYQINPVRDEAANPAIQYCNTSLSGYFAENFMGYGWWQGYNKKIAFDPVSGLFGSIYRFGGSDGGESTIGNIGGMYGVSNGTGINWEQTISTFPLQIQTSLFKGRNPTVVAADGYLFGFWNNLLNNTIPNALFSVYSLSEDEWSQPAGIKDNDEQSPPQALCGVADAVKDSGGTYHLLTSWQINGPESGDYTIVSGQSSTPSNNSSWQWTNWQNMTFGTNYEGTTLLSSPQVAWGQNGFGITVFSGRRNCDDRNQVLYTYTLNYGQNWMLDPNDKFYAIPTPCEFVGQQDSIGNELVDIEGFLIPQLDVVVDAGNSVHIGARVYMAGNGNPDNYYPDNGYTINGDPLNGVLYINGKLESNSINWLTGKIIAEAIGGRAEDTQPPASGANPATNHLYQTAPTAAVSIGIAGSGIIYIGWQDRPSDALHSTLGEFDFADPFTPWFGDGFFTLSTDNGSNWQLADQVKKRGFNVTNTRNQYEQGFTVSKRGRGFLGSSFEVFAAYQHAQSVPQLFYAPDFADCTQKYQAMQIYNTSTINTALLNDKTCTLAQNYPNPFNPKTLINYNLTKSENITLAVYNAKGEIVKTLFSGLQNTGIHSVEFDGIKLNSGVFFYRLETSGLSIVKKMLLVK